MPWNIFSSETPLFIQGMTGREGARLARWLISSGTKVVAGITPGKGGRTVEGCPIFHSLQEARAVFPSVQMSTIVVPAAHVREAVLEACENQIKYVTLLSEGIPVHDVIAMRRIAAEAGTTLLGPSSVGYLQFPPFRTGFIGGENPWEHLSEGSVAILSTSGGMANELMRGFARQGIGIRLAFALGGDYLSGYSLEDALSFCDALDRVDTIVLFVEPGRPFLNQLINQSIPPKKRLILFLVGDALDQLPRGYAYGHTGTLLSEKDVSVSTLRAKLSAQGINCVATQEECIQACK